MRRELKILLTGVCAVLGGCATVTNAGRFRTVSPEGGPPQPGQPTIRAAQLELRHLPPGTEIYEAGRELEIEEADTALHARLIGICRETETAIANLQRSGVNTPELREAVAVQQRSWPNGCSQRVLFFPVLVLDRAVPHTLRIVNGSRETTVTVKTSLHPKWLYWNFWLLAAYPVGLAVDGLSHNWNYFWPLDVGQVLASAGTTR
ncbi:MAG: hypothetical protein ACHQU1_00910 [Gemmatimonadales bacterium]